MVKSIVISAVCLLAYVAAFAQAGPPENWYNLDDAQDGVNGMSVEKAYTDVLKGMNSSTVIVAVIDGGCDPLHEDLKDVMWKNPGEIAGNGVDDDGNGYVDDVYGWNFIGGAGGKNVGPDALEVTRLYSYYKKMYDGKTLDNIKGKKNKVKFQEWLTIKSEVETKQMEGKTNAERMGSIRTNFLKGADNIQSALQGKAFTLENLRELQPEEEGPMGDALNFLMQVMVNDDVQSIDEFKQIIQEQLDGAVDYYTTSYKYHYNPDYDPRGIVGDNYLNSREKFYGNNDVKGPDAFHGTHVAGIIAASRNNGLGVNGVANNVRIMAVRAVPDGDERDKDVANAIRYAVDNGATVINMSFGKAYKWDKKVVDDAVKYATKHDVLLVHAAGNSHQNNDLSSNFPNDKYAKAGLFGPKKSATWLEIGALSWQHGQDAVATFSNYGKANVDIFAPGVDIFSTAPDNEYKSASGTSMASPATAGVAAMLRSYFPHLSAAQVKEVITSSGKANADRVLLPGSDSELVPFSDLSVTGATVNAYKAVEKAKKMKGKRKKKFIQNISM